MKPLAVVFWLSIFLSLWSHDPASGAQDAAAGGDADVSRGVYANGGADAGADADMDVGSNETLEAAATDSTEWLQSRLRSTGTAVLQYSPEAGELRLRVITEEQARTFHLAAGSVLLNSVRALRACLGEGTTFDRALAHRLYKKLIGPALPLLQNKTHLVIVPDRITGQIPFEALVPDTSSRRFLLHDYAVSYAGSLEALIRPEAPPSGYERQKVLAIAPFDVSSSEKEIMNIKADHVTGGAASLEGFKRKASDYTVIHLATYAILNEPSRAYIAFNPGVGEQKDASRLFIRDIPRLNLTGVSLVVLSPCPVVPGGYAPIPDLLNTARAFATAGCPNFMTSMWTREKETTYKISMKLHQYIHQGYGYAYALQKARIDYLENPAVDASLKSPSYWAGFILIGELNTTPQSHRIFYYFALAFSVLIVAFILRRKNKKDAERPEHSETICEPRSP